MAVLVAHTSTGTKEGAFLLYTWYVLRTVKRGPHAEGHHKPQRDDWG